MKSKWINLFKETVKKIFDETTFENVPSPQQLRQMYKRVQMKCTRRFDDEDKIKECIEEESYLELHEFDENPEQTKFKSSVQKLREKLERRRKFDKELMEEVSILRRAYSTRNLEKESKQIESDVNKQLKEDFESRFCPICKREKSCCICYREEKD